MEIEDIPEKGVELGYDALAALQDAEQKLEKAISNIEESGGDYTLVLSMIEKVRLKLTKTDLIITDLQAILEGLNNYYNGEQDVPKRRPTMDTSGNATEETENTGEG